MWKLFFLVVGLLICSYNGEVSVIGKNVTLECPGTLGNVDITKIWWGYTSGKQIFYCESDSCKENITTHALAKVDKYISFLTIHNVSLDDENEYSFKMSAFGGEEAECKRNLTITVPPIRLELVDTDGNELLQNNGSLIIGEGENKTVFCKTNAPTKPAVDLEWIIPNGLNVSANSSIYLQDDPDKRLSVPLLKLSFTLNVYDDDLVLVCRVASNSSFDEIRASIYIKNESELTANIGNIRTTSTDSHTLGASNGYTSNTQGSGAPYTTSLATSTSESETIVPDPSNGGEHLLAIAGGSGVAMLLIVLAFAAGFIRSKKGAVRRSVPAESTEFRPSQGRRALPPTPSDQSSLPGNHLHNQPPLTAQLFRPVPSNPPDIPMRPLVPVSEDAIRRTAERTGSRMPGETFMTTDGNSPVTQAQKESDTEMEYDLLNISHHGATGVVPHVYKETTNGLAEYAIVSRQQVDKRIDQRQIQRSKLMDDDSEYDLLNTWNQTEQGTVPHVYKETTNGLAEYAVVSKPEDKKKRQSLGPLTKVMKAPIHVEAEYAVVDKSKKKKKAK